MGKIVRRVGVGILGVLGCTLAGSGAAAGQNTPYRGGTGGSEFNAPCPEGTVLTGIGYSYGQWINRLNGMCRSVDMKTGETGSTIKYTTAYGTTGAVTNSKECPRGHAIHSFQGKAGWYVHQLTLICHKLGSSGRTGTTNEEFYIGPGGAEPFSKTSCAEAKPGTGIAGRYGTYIDAFGLKCGYIMPSNVVLTVPANNTDITTRRPTFDWDPSTWINMPYKICLNLSAGAGCSISGTVKADVTDSKWIPGTDLPFTRGDLVYWRVEACNDNGCKNAVRAFRYMP